METDKLNNAGTHAASTVRTVLSGVLLPLGIALLTILLALFALGILPMPTIPVSDQTDDYGNRYSGNYVSITGEFVGPAHVVFALGITYDGELLDGRFSGWGKVSGNGQPGNSQNGDQTDDSQSAGQNSSQSDDQSDAADFWQLEGTFVNGRLIGQGKYSDAQGRYEGAFEQSLPQGNGVYYCNAGWRYEGEFLAGAMTGRGTVYVKDGTIYSGIWQGGILISED
ncbi:MAG: hypothetical protein LBC35_01090 [Coriobacteriales bacterium]|nr:hypothetical protein [Coriobacteriales bacterium]